MGAGLSNYADDGSPDTATTLATGAASTSTTLAADIDDAETILEFADPIVADRQGGAVFIEGETIIYTRLSFDPDYPTMLYDVIRGADGTSAASHTATTPVMVTGRSRYNNPALVEALIATQMTIIAQAALIAALDERVEALES